MDHEDDPTIPETEWEREIRESDELDELGYFAGEIDCPNPGDCCLCGTCSCATDDD